MPWYIAGVAVGALAIVLIVQQLQSPETASLPAAPPVATGGAPNPGAIDVQNMDPREAADRLYNRVMEGFSAGDSAQARAFLPMALAAYQRVGALDLDARYHITLLHLVNGDAAAARAEAGVILDEAPTHLLALSTAAEAEALLGNREAARALYSQFLENYDTEIATSRREYTDHASVLPVMREDATEFLATATP
jgi:hypothetical protein